MTEPPLSRQIQLLEQSLGVNPLERTSRSVRLTAARHAFLREAYRVLEAAEGAERAAQQVARGEAGSFRLGFTAASADQALPRLVAGMRDGLPDIDLVLEEMVADEQAEALAKRQLDLALMRPLGEMPDGVSRIQCALLLRERLLLAVPNGHALASGGHPSLADLNGQDLVTWSPRGGAYFVGLTASIFRGGGVAPRIVQRVNQTHTILSLVSAGIGVALVPESSVYAKWVTLRPLRLPEHARAELVLAWRSDDDNPALPRVRRLALALLSSKKRDGSADPHCGPGRKSVVGRDANGVGE